MSCDEARELLSAMLDGEASRDEADRAARHVAGCPACLAYRAGIATDRSLLRAWRDEPIRPSRALFRTTVVAAASTYQKLAENDLGEPVTATPAAVDGYLYVRGHEHLYCIRP